MGIASFFAELKRRNVLRAATLYAAGAWLIVQVITQVGPVFDLPASTQRWAIIALLIGFPFAMVLSWVYELTPDGFKRDEEVAPEASIAPQTGKRLDRAIIVVLSIAVVLLLTNTFLAHKDLTTDAGRAAAAPAEKSIAVLPLANRGNNKDEQYFSDGLSEDLITALSQLGGLKVIGRDSSFRFRDSKDDPAAIGRKLGVANLLEGSVRREGEFVRINAELVKASDGVSVWSQKYDRPYKDLFKLQDEITEAVALALKTRLLPEAGAVAQSDRPPGGSLDAYAAYKRGNLHRARDTEADYRIALDAYREAIRLDPRYAQAYAALSASEATLAAEYLGGEDARKSFAAGRNDANAALAIDPGNAAAHRALALVFNWGDLDWNQAEVEYLRAVQLAPADADAQIDYASSLAALGRVPEATEITRKALATEPLHVFGLSYYALYLAYAGRLDEAKATSRKAIDLQPDSLIANWAYITILAQRGEAASARDLAAKAPAGSMKDWLQAEVEQSAGNQPAADALLKTLLEKDGDIDAMQIAEIYAQRKDADNTFAWLERAWKNRDPGLSFLLYDAFLRPYGSDPRFAAFCRKIGLPAPGAATGSTTAAASGTGSIPPSPAAKPGRAP